LLCPKCRYQRQPSDDAPDWQCPSCGVAYAKAHTANTTSKYVEVSDIKTGTTVNSGFSFKKLRISILLLILAVVALDNWLTTIRSTDWQDSLWAVVYPVNADNSQAANEYINSISTTDFRSVQAFFASETRRYGIELKDPVEIRLGPVVNEVPPLPPEDRSVLKTMWWSLQLRYWSVAVDEYNGPRPDIRVFVLYNQPENNKRLPHSTGLKKGMVSVVHAFADKKMSSRNNVVIAHELLHTLGASDKYDLQTTLPIFPDGYAEPDNEPLFPQQFAEIMAGRIAVSETTSIMPESLKQALVGAQTATEIGWRSVE